MRLTVKTLVYVGALFCVWNAFAQTSVITPELPAPTRILQDGKQFKAVTLGPGSTFSIQETPPDFQLNSFDLSPDGNWTFMNWDSGRLEIRENATGKRIAQFKPMRGPVFEADYNPQPSSY